MITFRRARDSLIGPLLGVYLLFVGAVLATDLQVNAAVQQQVQAEVQTADSALAQEIALDTQTTLHNAEKALVSLSQLTSVRQGSPQALPGIFAAFKAARPDVDLVYWLSPSGTLQVSVPANVRTAGSDYSYLHVFQQARTATQPIIADGVVDLTTFNAVVIMALPIRAPSGVVRGILAINLLLDDLSAPLQTIIAAQAQQHQHILISIVDAQGRLIASPQRERLLQPVSNDLPGASGALAGQSTTTQGTDASKQQWLYSAVPVGGIGWAVVVQRSTADALAAVANFRVWITVATVLFALGGLFFWLVLLRRVVQPLHVLATRHAAVPTIETLATMTIPALTGRADEIGRLSRVLNRLEHDVVAQLAELRTLLDTSNAVVTSLDPYAVGLTIIQEVRRLIDVQAAAFLVPDDHNVLRVLVSDGRVAAHDEAVQIRPDDLTVPSALALHNGHPVQMIAGEDVPFPALAQAHGFRAVLAIPIISRHVGGVVLVVHRTQQQRFAEHEVELLLTFANYATLAWEHAVLYERSDERLRAVAQENEQLYRQATSEKQTLAAIMRSMTDGLILTDVEGIVLFANPGAGLLIGRATETMVGQSIETIHEYLQDRTHDPAAYATLLARVRAGGLTDWIIDLEDGPTHRVLNLRLFDVRDDTGVEFGRGLLLRDVTREQEIDRLKSTLLDAVGHEFRTPLAAIKGYASTLLQTDVVWSADDQHSFLQTISTEADRLAALVSNLLDLSRLEAGLLLLHRAPARLEDLVARTARRLPAPLPAMTVDLPAQLPLFSVDAARIEVVLYNLLTNALAYGDGCVAISAEICGTFIVIHISDNGPGLSAAELPHIFERFYRSEHGSRRRASGTGLGLAICKAFVEAHGGTIWAENGARGTIISFSVPINPPEQGDQEQGDQEQGDQEDR